jgi:5-formyltetrahydrofolate cyclo-ligase
VTEAKRELRRAVRAARDGLAPAERAERSRRIAERLLGLPELGGARTVMVFSSFGSEVDTGPILRGLAARGVRLALPRIAGGEVVAVAYRPGDRLVPTALGVPEPADGAPLPEAEIDIVVTPGVAFDRAGYRVGYGGGFYDRFLRRVRPEVPRIAIAFALQVVPEVPHGEGDERVDLIVTEDEVIRCPPR